MMPFNGREASDHDWGLTADMKDNINNINNIINTNGGKEEFPSSKTRGSIAERRAANLGFDASRMSVDPSCSSSSPLFFTIPSGISPGALLESPVMLPNSQRSPTTGTFPLASLKLYEEKEASKSRAAAAATAAAAAAAITETFAKFSFTSDDLISTQIPSASIAENANNNDNQAQQSFEFSSDYGKSEEESSINKCDDNDNDAEKSKRAKGKEVVEDIDMKPSTSVINHHQNHGNTHQNQPLGGGEDLGQTSVLSFYGRSGANSDGFFWRKYGQNRVKRNSFPRSYYKCNSTNCSVRKKVEKIDETNIQVFYLDEHNHPQADADGNELGAKRRKTESITHETKYIFQITSEVDDRYRWRKYGQKVVKENKNPRNYYKCTYEHCPVKKHVERASDDKKSVLTSYEGKHNHAALPPKTTANSRSNSRPTVLGIKRRKNHNVVPNPNIQAQDLGHSSSIHPMEIEPFVMDTGNNTNTNYPFVMNTGNTTNTNHPFVFTAGRETQTTPSSYFAPPNFPTTMPLNMNLGGVSSTTSNSSRGFFNPRREAER